MERAGMSGLQLAVAADVDKNSVVRWRKGRVLPRQENLVAVADALNTTVDDLAGRSRPAVPPFDMSPAQQPTASTTDEDVATELLDRILQIADSAQTLAPDLMTVLLDAREYVAKRGTTRISSDANGAGDTQ